MRVDVAQKSSVSEVMCVCVAVQSMAWLGQKVVLCTSLRYMLLQPTQGTSTQLFALAEDAPSPTLVQSIPSANLAVLLMVVFRPSHHPCCHLKCCLIMSLASKGRYDPPVWFSQV